MKMMRLRRHRGAYHAQRNATADFWRRYDAPVTLP